MRETKPFVVFLQTIIEIILGLTVWGGVWTEGTDLPSPPMLQVAVDIVFCC